MSTKSLSSKINALLNGSWYLESVTRILVFGAKELVKIPSYSWVFNKRHVRLINFLVKDTPCSSGPLLPAFKENTFNAIDIHVSNHNLFKYRSSVLVLAKFPKLSQKDHCYSFFWFAIKSHCVPLIDMQHLYNERNIRSMRWGIKQSSRITKNLNVYTHFSPLRHCVESLQKNSKTTI